MLGHLHKGYNCNPYEGGYRRDNKIAPAILRGATFDGENPSPSYSSPTRGEESGIVGRAKGDIQHQRDFINISINIDVDLSIEREYNRINI